MKKIDELYTAILSLENRAEARAFFRDLLTEEEIVEFANRWRVAQLLDEGVAYTKIQDTTGMSSTTVARISKWLTSGMGGYAAMIKKMKLQSHHHIRPRKV